MKRKYIKEIKQTAKNGKEAYSNYLEETLKKEIVSLRDILKEFVKTHAKEEEFGLIISNDASSEIELFEMVDRVKNPESLEEKIIRNQDFFDLMNKDSKELIELIKEKNDDLMGLRFLVSLSCDCKKLYDLLNKYNSELVKHEILFLNLEQNPQTMRNGRPIYRIKGKYKTYPFELQIKSKVDSAWADIEHMLFYKDYQFSYIQSTNKLVMKKLGDLLDQVDELMIQVRESQISYEKDRKEMTFTQYLGNRFRNQIHKIIGSAFVLSEYRRVLFYIFSSFEPWEQEHILDIDNELVISELYTFNATDTENKLVKNYMKLSEKSLEFAVAEHIYFDWLNTLKKIDNSHTISVDNLRTFFEYLIEGLIKEKMEYYLKSGYINEQYIEWSIRVIINYLDIKELTFNLPLFIVDSEKMYMLYSFYKANQTATANMSVDEDNEAGKTPEQINDYITKIQFEVIAYLFEKDINNINEYSKKIIAIMEECPELSKYCSAKFIEKMNEEYSKVKKTISGKAMPNNILLNLIQCVLKIQAGGTM